MTKRILSVMVVLILMVSLFAGCGASKAPNKASTGTTERSMSVKDGNGAQYGTATAADQAAGGAARSGAAAPGAEQPKMAEAKTTASTAITGTDVTSQTVPNIILSQRKVIRNANISIEVEDFDKAYGQVGTIISAFGFIQESNIKKDKIYVEGKETFLTKGVIIIRVSADRFESVLKDVKGLGQLLDENIKSDDITDKFFDTESSLRVLKIEQEKLEEYLKKLTELDAIFKTQSRLTEIRKEIESLTGTLRKWSDLVDLSTITINISEKRPGVSQIVIKEKTYVQRLFEGFTGSVKGVVSFFGELVIALAQALPVLVLLGFLGWAGRLAYKKFYRGRKKGNDSKDDTPTIN